MAPTVTVVRPAVKVLLVAWSTLKPVSLFELSVQPRLIWLEEAAVAVRPLGAVGTVWVPDVKRTLSKSP